MSMESDGQLARGSEDKVWASKSLTYDSGPKSHALPPPGRSQGDRKLQELTMKSREPRHM